jgi:hypothetical protein
MLNKVDGILFLILALLLALIGSFFYTPVRENFISNLLQLGVFPESVSKPILYGDYPLQKGVLGLSDLNSKSLSAYYPVFPSSYLQRTNNVRYWATPNDGTCSPANMCGTLYDNKTLNIPKFPRMVPFSSKQTRVNMFAFDEYAPSDVAGNNC